MVDSTLTYLTNLAARLSDEAEAARLEALEHNPMPASDAAWRINSARLQQLAAVRLTLATIRARQDPPLLEAPAVDGLA